MYVRYFFLCGRGFIVFCRRIEDVFADFALIRICVNRGVVSLIGD